MHGAKKSSKKIRVAKVLGVVVPVVLAMIWASGLGFRVVIIRSPGVPTQVNGFANEKGNLTLLFKDGPGEPSPTRIRGLGGFPGLFSCISSPGNGRDPNATLVSIFYGGLIAPFGLMWLAYGCRQWWLMDRRRFRVLHGRCVHCGYDLRAHKPGGQCPECGRIIGFSPLTADDNRQRRAIHQETHWRCDQFHRLILL